MLSTLARPIDDKPSRRAVIRLSVLPLVRFLSLYLLTFTGPVASRYRLKRTRLQTRDF